MPEFEKLWTVQELADLSQLSDQTVRRIIRELNSAGEIRIIKINDHSIRVPESEIEKILNS